MNTLPVELIVYHMAYDVASYRALLAIPLFAREMMKTGTMNMIKERFTLVTREVDVEIHTLCGMKHRCNDKPAKVVIRKVQLKYTLGSLHFLDGQVLLQSHD